jgi:hypothetical protein
LDDINAIAASWCEEVRGLCGDTAELPADGDGPRLGNGGPATLTDRLDAIGEGIRLRRRLDGLVPDEATEASRRAVVSRLVDLQRSAAEELAALRPGMARHREVATRARDWLTEARVALRNLLTVLQFEPLHQAMALEALRADLEWLSIVVARLDGEAPLAPTVWMDVELERLRSSLSPPDGRHRDRLDEPIRLRCERMKAGLLERRVRRELVRSLRGISPEPLWVQRFHLSRLQAQVAALDLGADSNPGPKAALSPEQPRDWLEEVARRRAELAADADDRMAALPPPARREACTAIIQSAFDEVGEITAFLGQMPPRRAVRRLKLAEEDLERLAESCRRWADDLAGGPGAVTGLVAQPPDGADSRATTADPDEADSDGAAEDPDEASRADDRAAARESAVLLRRQTLRVERLGRRVHREWQETLLNLRLTSLLGRRIVAFLENAVLVLIPVLIGLIATEYLIERSHPLSAAQHRFFAWADLAICSVFLLDLGLRLCLAPDRLRYLLHHLVVDLIPSLPFGFVSHEIALAEMGTTAAGQEGTLEVVAEFGRMAQVLRFARLVLPIARLTRIGLIVLRLSDRLVRRLAPLLNRNIILFEPSAAQKPESSDRHRLLAIRGELEHARSTLEGRLDRQQSRALAARVLSDFEGLIRRQPAPALEGTDPDEEQREIPVEAVVERLIQMTPEQLVDRMGPSFVLAADRYLRLLNLPLIRHLPLSRKLASVREKSPAEAVALAANYLGHLIQRALDGAYFLADLQGTLSPPVFLDRLGATIVNATRTPAKRLLWLGGAFFILFVIVELVAFLKVFRPVVVTVQNLLGWPVIILGVICLGFWALGAWFRKIANQAADFSERVVEAQFAAHTKGLKSRRREQDALFLSERVIDPELLLRSSDDRIAMPSGSAGAGAAGQPVWFLFENRELAFLRNVRLLYQDYLDGSPLHRSDTKASVQLLGNLALTNLRRSHLRHLLRESRMLDRLDLSRSGGLLGGPYLWFNYITRMLVQETAILILDYNRHAIPVDRLACSPDPVRHGFRTWLARRLKVDPEAIWLPEPVVPDSGSPAAPGAMVPGSAPRRPRRAANGGDRSRRAEAEAFLETVEFTAVDFLADDPDRDAEIRARFGPQVAELVRRDRQQNVRRAFRSFPLHELPTSSRTINPFNLYETYLSGGRVALLPLIVLGAMARVVGLGVRSVLRVVHEILHPKVDQDRTVPPDTYWAALRKIHRMRKPVFMGSLWLRARFDAEYLGLALPTAPPGISAQSLMEVDLDYIGATRQDRIIAEQVRHEHHERLEWVAGWLHQFGWTFDELPNYLAREIPYLANRGGEALRALVTACVLDHDDIATLALSIEGLKRVMAHAADPSQNRKQLPAGLPEPVVGLRTLWYPVHRCRRPLADLFGLPCFPAYDPSRRARITRYLRRHRRAVRGWIKVVLGQGGPDPWVTVKARMRDVMLRTDLWSDQILVLRAVQTLTMLDVQHNCELVWALGGYTSPEPGGTEPEARPPIPLLRRDEHPVPTLSSVRDASITSG